MQHTEVYSPCYVLMLHILYLILQATSQAEDSPLSTSLPGNSATPTATPTATDTPAEATAPAIETPADGVRYLVPGHIYRLVPPFLS